jgi:large subunit ribosomal protein L15
MKLHELAPPPGSKKERKRVGRGDGSGHGTFSGRGSKGQKARSGGGHRPGFEGGQLPLIKRLPEKRGFANIFRQEYDWVNLESLNIFPPGSEVGPERLREVGLIKGAGLVKVLGRGELKHSLVVKAHAFSGSARKRIEALGGKAEVIVAEER